VQAIDPTAGSNLAQNQINIGYVRDVRETF